MAGTDRSILIAGGGPAGTSTAIALAASGLEVELIDRAHFPRPRIGESLPPKIAPALAALGVLEAVEAAGFTRMKGTTVAQGNDITRHDFDPLGRHLGWQVDRGRFDQLLLERAKTLGVAVTEGEAALAPILDGERIAGLLVKRGDGGEAERRAGMIVDATGGSALLGRALGLRKRDDVRTVALAAEWTGARGPDDLPPENTLFELFEDGWIWSVLKADGRRNVTLGLDAKRVKTRDSLPLELYRERVTQGRLIGPLLTQATLDSELSAWDATGYSAREVIGPGWIVAGDASSVIDPLTSQGVYKAIQSGLAAAAVIRTLLLRPESSALAERYFRDTERELFARYAEIALSFYRASPFRHRPFWSTRLDPARLPHSSTEAAPELRAARREAFLEQVRGLGGQRLHLRADPRLRIEEHPAAEGGFVVTRPAIVTPEGEVLPLPGGTERAEPRVLLPLLDGRAMAKLFDDYAAATGEPPSAELGRKLIAALAVLAEHAWLSVETT